MKYNYLFEQFDLWQLELQTMLTLYLFAKLLLKFILIHFYDKHLHRYFFKF